MHYQHEKTMRYPRAEYDWPLKVKVVSFLGCASVKS